MRLNEFGRMARMFRMELDLSLKSMAEAMLISSAHLSALEYGDKKLNEAHINMAASYFAAHGIDADRLNQFRQASAMAMESINIKDLPGDARAKVYAFARLLEEGGNEEIDEFLKRRK